jgi:GTPase SAR1 family protein
MTERGERFVTREDAEEVQRKFKAVRYMECSALTGYNVKEAFEDAARAVLNKENVKQFKKKECILL